MQNFNVLYNKYIIFQYIILFFYRQNNITTQSNFKFNIITPLASKEVFFKSYVLSGKLSII